MTVVKKLLWMNKQQTNRKLYDQVCEDCNNMKLKKKWTLNICKVAPYSHM